MGVFYRDGVGAGQEDNVRAQEVEQIKAFFERQGMNVKFTFIIVAKRINTRFYKKQGNQYVNPPSGSVFDDVVTLPERYDFFIGESVHSRPHDAQQELLYYL